MRLKISLLFLPLIVSAVAKAQSYTNEGMPDREVPRPLPRPTLFQPLKPIAETESDASKIDAEEPIQPAPRQLPPRPVIPPRLPLRLPNTTPTTGAPPPKPSERPRPLTRLPLGPRPIPRPTYIGPVRALEPSMATKPALRPRPIPERKPEPTPAPKIVPESEPESKPQPKPMKPPIKPKPRPGAITPKPYNSNILGDGIPIEYKCIQDGYFSIANECDTYIECRKRIALKFECPDGLHFNRKAKYPDYACAYPSEVQCDSRDHSREPKPTSECPRQYGFYSMKDGDCSQYIMCQEGLASVMRCPPGLVFNQKESACDWPANVPNCKPSVFQGFTCPPATTTDENGEPYDIIYKYKYGRSCTQYIACQLGHPRLLSCDPGLAFDEASEVCIDADYVPGCENEVRY